MKLGSSKAGSGRSGYTCALDMLDECCDEDESSPGDRAVSVGTKRGAGVAPT